MCKRIYRFYLVQAKVFFDNLVEKFEFIVQRERAFKNDQCYLHIFASKWSTNSHLRLSWIMICVSCGQFLWSCCFRWYCGAISSTCHVFSTKTTKKKLFVDKNLARKKIVHIHNQYTQTNFIICIDIFLKIIFLLYNISFQ